MIFLMTLSINTVVETTNKIKGINTEIKIIIPLVILAILGMSLYLFPSIFVSKKKTMGNACSSDSVFFLFIRCSA